MITAPHWRLKAARWLFATIAISTCFPAPVQPIERVIIDPNRPVYEPATPLSWRERARPPLNPDPTVDSYEFFGGDNIQDPPNPYVYLVGRDVGRDLASPTRSYVGDGIPDTWLRLNLRSLGFYQGRGGGYSMKEFILQTIGYPYRRWDTIANSRYPLLQVILNGQRINSASGSIAGFNPPQNQTIDLFIADDGLIAIRHTPMELIIIGLDGEYRLRVNLHNPRDVKID
ncbi:hypothetical protein [uncultured Thiodictyon sp.]|uniref:hypothetical protein n=1 Tax=uncultured Thiodictyon sp. TaxID=1846217 RepID=UPI0025D151D2|nr:hypothetical protein [uncultured Thiodictyon sp.]